MSTITAEALERRPRVTRETVVNVLPYALVAILFGVNAIVIDGYTTKPNLISLLIQASFLGMASLGQTLVVMIGGVDLAVPAVIGLADVVGTQLYGNGMPFGVILVILLALCVIIGVVNALSSVLLGVHSLIITLAMGLVITGGVLTWTHGNVSGNVPDWVHNSVSVIDKTGPIPLPIVVVVWIVVSIAAIVLQRTTRVGKEIYTTGSNAIAARLAGVRVTRTVCVAFVVSAIFAGVVGIFFSGYSGTADDTVGNPYLFETLTAVVIGGTSLLGGAGGYGRTVAGTLVLVELTDLLVGEGFGQSMQEALLGALILIIAIVYGRESHVSNRI
jgi:ribose transport system permease protein